MNFLSKKKNYSKYTERDTFSNLAPVTSRTVIEGDYCRIFKGAPRIVPIQTSVPNETFRELSDQFGHVLEGDATREELIPIFAGRVCYQSFGDKAGRKSADDYLSHIMDVGHYSILEHSSVSLYFDRVPRFWSHEQVRHRHFNYSQLSQRFYVPDKVELVIPPALWDTNKIEEEFYAYGEEVGKQYRNRLSELYSDIGEETFALKKKSREAARAILPECTETKIVVTGNFRSWLEYLQKRNSPDADATFQEVAKIVKLRLQQVAPNIYGKGV